MGDNLFWFAWSVSYFVVFFPPAVLVWGMVRVAHWLTRRPEPEAEVVLVGEEVAGDAAHPQAGG